MPSKFVDHYIKTNNIQLHYIEYPNPSKPTFILMHGLTANSQAFGGLVVEGLAERFHLICPDLRGRGKSDKPAFRYSFRDHAMDIIGLIEHLGLKDVIIGGHSFGGLLSVYMAYHFPARIRKVILLDAAAEMNPNTFDMLGPTLGRLDKIFPSYHEYMDEMKRAKQNVFWEPAMEFYYQADIQLRDDGTVTPIPNLTNIYRIATHVANEPWKKYFSKIAQPTLLINGTDNYSEDEPILPDFKAKESVKMLAQGTYQRVDGNHQTMLYGTGAKQVVEAIINFVDAMQKDTPQPHKEVFTVAVVGATGVVGSTILQILEERDFPVGTIVPVASERSAGSNIIFKGEKIKVVTPEMALQMHCDLAIFSAGGATSLKYAPMFAEKGVTVIDNSSAWRMDPDKKLIVPEVNGDTLTASDTIIANPNCSTIQLVVALKPLHDAFKIKRVVVSTYQSVSGSGLKGLQQLEAEQAGKDAEAFYPYPISGNILPHIDEFTENGYTKEEMKMVNETMKILGDDSVKVTATTVRVPVRIGHSESVNIEFKKDFELEDIYSTLNNALGIVLLDNPSQQLYPMPLEAEGKDEVFVGRIRKDFTQPKTLNCWIVADNLRKGAATNAIQIAETLVEKQLIGKPVEI